ncbi:helix-turn-helix transcriptional regulator [Chakrabartyella piscis]|uniref:helix-turn-helix domain-containing protein n=1 Tax=Chakrabartyella piscis TaxID=2918914 RepID=UPI002958B7EE|nr:helix-turn-helix transcriptional regulator [Chakrabartyella piscis]
MKEIPIHVGNRIRLYRKMKHLTIESFAVMIGKSKATISKYETGDISIDIETLFEIAQALGVSINQLVDYEMPSAEEHITPEHPGSKSRLYLYFYDGRKNRIVKNVIEVQGKGENGVHTASFYADLDEDFNIYKCRYMYQGKMQKYDSFTNFTFENQNNKIEKAFLYAIHPFSPAGHMVGLFSGLSTQPILPVSFKVIISPYVMGADTLQQELAISKEQLKHIKKMNMFVVDQHN